MGTSETVTGLISTVMYCLPLYTPTTLPRVVTGHTISVENNAPTMGGLNHEQPGKVDD